MEKLTKFDVAEYLDTDELQTLYLDEVAKENDPAALIKAIDTVARAKGMTKTAKEAGISREGLYKALSPEYNGPAEPVRRFMLSQAPNSIEPHNESD